MIYCGWIKVLMLIIVLFYHCSISPRRVMLIGMLSQIVVGNLTGFVTTYGLHVFFR